MAAVDADIAALDALLDELDAAQDRARRATWTVAELEEAAEEGEVGRAELTTALARMEAAQAWVDELKRKRAKAEDALDRLDMLRVHARRARG